MGPVGIGAFLKRIPTSSHTGDCVLSWQLTTHARNPAVKIAKILVFFGISNRQISKNPNRNLQILHQGRESSQ
jgi:hypothetical protein